MYLKFFPRKSIVSTVTWLTGVLCFASLALAQSSANFDLGWSTLSSGGGTRASATVVLHDSLSSIGGVASGATTRIEAGFVPGIISANAGPAGGDAFEQDNVCTQASVIPADGSKQNHDFHFETDADWLRFTTEAGKTYIIEVKNVGDKANAIVFLYDACDQAAGGTGDNSFGSTVRLEWDATKNGDYFVKLQPYDGAFFGAGTNYEVSVTVDNVPPTAPKSPRCTAINGTTLAVQWTKSPERDVKGYRIAYNGTPAGNEDVAGKETTYYELGGLNQNQTYTMRVRAIDFSGNEGALSGEFQCVTTPPPDSTKPILALSQPGDAANLDTAATQLTFSGTANDAGNNLSRVHVRNATKNVDAWDYSLSGSSDDFRVTDLPIGIGNNNIEVTVFDEAGNSTTKTVTVQRQGNSPGAVIIVAGHNETFGLQTNIYNAANRAYRIFQSAGYNADTIYYIAPVAQDADGDGNSDVDGVASPAEVQKAVTQWAKDKVGDGKPLFMYLMDHGFADKFCVSGCGDAGKITPADLDGWLRNLEQASGVNQVNVIFEACQSGSFLDRHNGDVANSLSKAGRVIITSTSRELNAYASAQGAYFSDEFFSCIADSGSIKACFDLGKQAVQTAGVSQEPWMDDNGDGISDDNDGQVAKDRYITRFFSSVRPTIKSTEATIQGTNGVLSAKVEEGAEDIDIVWAAVYPPSFKEPDTVTINLNVPTVRLEPDPAQPGTYTFNYTNGFTESGDIEKYRIVFYAQDTKGIQASPKRRGEVDTTSSEVYLPFVLR